MTNDGTCIDDEGGGGGRGGGGSDGSSGGDFESAASPSSDAYVSVDDVVPTADDTSRTSPSGEVVVVRLDGGEALEASREDSSPSPNNETSQATPVATRSDTIRRHLSKQLATVEDVELDPENEEYDADGDSSSTPMSNSFTAPQEMAPRARQLVRGLALCGDDDTRLRPPPPSTLHRNAHSLSRESSGTTDLTDSSGIDLRTFVFTTLHKNPRDRQMILGLEQQLSDFVTNEERQSLKFGVMSSYNRMLVHRISVIFGLDHNIDNSGQCVVVNKTERTKLPDFRFNDMIQHNNFTDSRRGMRYVHSLEEVRGTGSYYGYSSQSPPSGTTVYSTEALASPRTQSIDNSPIVYQRPSRYAHPVSMGHIGTARSFDGATPPLHAAAAAGPRAAVSAQHLAQQHVANVVSPQATSQHSRPHIQHTTGMTSVQHPYNTTILKKAGSFGGMPMFYRSASVGHNISEDQTMAAYRPTQPTHISVHVPSAQHHDMSHHQLAGGMAQMEIGDYSRRSDVGSSGGTYVAYAQQNGGEPIPIPTMQPIYINPSNSFVTPMPTTMSSVTSPDRPIYYTQHVQHVAHTPDGNYTTVPSGAVPTAGYHTQGHTNGYDRRYMGMSQEHPDYHHQQVPQYTYSPVVHYNGSSYQSAHYPAQAPSGHVAYVQGGQPYPTQQYHVYPMAAVPTTTVPYATPVVTQNGNNTQVTEATTITPSTTTTAQRGGLEAQALMKKSVDGGYGSMTQESFRESDVVPEAGEH